MTKSKLVISDLDGTLANCEHRVHFVRDKPKDWNAFYAGVLDDKVNEAVLRVCYAFASVLVFTSGRPERCRQDTMTWLAKFGLAQMPLFMRSNNDYRRDYIIKQEILDKYLGGASNILFAMDDRQQVVDMWRRNAITTFQVAKGDF